MPSSTIASSLFFGRVFSSNRLAAAEMKTLPKAKIYATADPRQPETPQGKGFWIGCQPFIGLASGLDCRNQAGEDLIGRA